MFGPIDGEMSRTGDAIDLTIKPTYDTYEQLEHAYGHFNLALFDHRLPNCLITLQRKGRCFGYFAASRMARQDGKTCDEIALNPVHFRKQGDLQTLSILVHEMVHLWQQHFGKPGRGRYHNLQWAAEMKRVGLHPSHTGQPDGRETGDQMWHYIIEGGPFEQAAKELIAGGFKIAWTEDGERPRRHRPEVVEERRRDPALTGDWTEGGEDSPVLVDPLDGLLDLGNGGAGGDDGDNDDGADDDAPLSKSGVRVKYTCPVCSLNAWSRHEAEIKCVAHDQLMVPTG
ncbi:MAG: SprT-like domain-containing protein [Pseudomonadota bacterium]